MSSFRFFFVSHCRQIFYFSNKSIQTIQSEVVLNKYVENKVGANNDHPRAAVLFG